MDRRPTFLEVLASQLHRLSVSDLLLLIHATVAELQSRFFVPPPVAEYSDIEA